MSLLGFDALGRLALGQLPIMGATNTVLIAGNCAYVLTGQDAVFRPSQIATSGNVALSGSAATHSTKLLSSSATCLVRGNAVAFRLVTPLNVGTFLVGGNSARFGIGVPCFGAATAVSSDGCVLAISMTSTSGSYMIAGYPTTFARDFEAWIPRPFDTDGWTATSGESVAWTGNASTTSPWTAASEPVGIWVPAVIQPEPWTKD